MSNAENTCFAFVLFRRKFSLTFPAFKVFYIPGVREKYIASKLHLSSVSQFALHYWEERYDFCVAM